MKKSAHLTPGEFELMEILWPIGEATVKDVWQKVDPARKLAYTTVMTVLEKMYRKGILNQRKKGKAYIYSVALSRDEVFKGVLEHICSTYFGGSGEALVAAVEKRFVADGAVQKDPSIPAAPEATEARSGPDNRDPSSNRT